LFGNDQIPPEDLICINASIVDQNLHDDIVLQPAGHVSQEGAMGTDQNQRIEEVSDVLDNTFDQEISADAVRRQLDEILSSTIFDASDRNRRFLRYIVEEALANRGVRIKGYSVGISVFDRDENFDPQIDPVVRIEAGRLRRSLERYYLIDGGRANVRISVPKGAYVPHFQRLMPAKRMTNVAEDTVKPLRDPTQSILALHIVPLSGDKRHAVFAAGLSEEMIFELSKHRCVSVFAEPATMTGGEQRPLTVQNKYPLGLVLSGSVRITGAKLRVIARLVNQSDNLNLWSTSLDRCLGRPTLIDLERDVARSLCDALFRYIRRADLSQ
jgi:TolB-like protein